MAPGAYRDKAPSQVTSSGYVVDSLDAALWSVWTTDSFDATMLHAVNLDDDADPTAAVAARSLARRMA